MQLILQHFYINFLKNNMSQELHTQKYVWLDCDPGIDDLMAIVLCGLDPRINLIGISTSAGNSTVENTTQNALDILCQINREDVPVIKGSSQAIIGGQDCATHIHGKNGLDGAKLKTSKKKAIEKEPYLQIYKRIMNCSEKIYFINTGSMTNLAILLNGFPEIRQKITQISIMAGAIGLGNQSPSAEFNIWFDPMAAKIVFESGMNIAMVPLQVTHTALANEQIFEGLQKMQTEFADKIHGLFKFFQRKYMQYQNFQYPPVHDPCAVFYILSNNEFMGRNAEVVIDIYPTSNGRTNCYFKSKNPNAFVCEKMNVKKFWEVMMSALAKVNSV